MRLKELLEGVAVQLCTAELTGEITGVSCDSQKIKPGNVFVAIPGQQTDGRHYIAQAMARGAYCVVSGDIPPGGMPFVQTRQVRQALALMARNYFGDPASAMTLVGVTGTNGKTTTTYLIKHILETTLHTKVGLIGTIQNMVGDRIEETERTTPDALQLYRLLRTMADEGCTHVVMEVSSHALALERVYGLHFAVGVFTNLTQDHLDFHRTMADYCAAKAQLFAQCDMAIYNEDDPWHEKIMAQAGERRLSYGVTSPSALQAKEIELTASGVAFQILSEQERIPVQLSIPGKFTVYNALATIGTCRALGIPLRDGAEVLRSYRGVKGRMEVVPTPGKAYTVMVDYAHTPDALANVLTAVCGFAEGKVWAVFGCGGDRDRTKRPKMGAIAAEKADIIIVTDDNPRTELSDAIRRDIIEGMPTSSCWREIPDRREAIFYAMTHAAAGDVIVLCGKGHETYQEIGRKKYHLDEREIVASFLEHNK